MHPSTASAGPTAVQKWPQGLPALGEAPYRGVTRPARVPNPKGGGVGANSPVSELAPLMEEPAGGDNHGRRASDNPAVEGRYVQLQADTWQATEYARAGGWTMITDVPGSERRGGGWQRAGGTTHRGPLHPEEHVDPEILRPLVERELGFTYEQVHSVYRQGPLTVEQRGLRGRIDARVLALSRAGAGVALLGECLGFVVKANGNCRAMENALTRARAEEV